MTAKQWCQRQMKRAILPALEVTQEQPKPRQKLGERMGQMEGGVMFNR